MKLHLLVLLGTSCLLLTACSKKDNSPQGTTSTPTNTQNDAPSTSKAATPAAAESATSSTSSAAQQSTTNGTIHGVIREKAGKFVLSDTPDGMVFSLTNQKAAKGLVGKSVMVSGHIDHQTKVIHVHKIESM